MAPRIEQLQELYLHLDGTGWAADQRVAYYGQLRAQEHDHETALRLTVEHFNLVREPWYRRRVGLPEGEGLPMWLAELLEMGA